MIKETLLLIILLIQITEHQKIILEEVSNYTCMVIGQQYLI